ncbi:MAG: DUF192 domain-containing protein [Spirochaetia bacterium]|nr:DUF192 domain-containing protein [Spirochaetia bacterium]
MKKLLVLILSAVIFSFSCTAEKGKYRLPVENIQIVKNDSSRLTVRSEIAAKQEERNYGFMNRKHIPAGTGMLFVFEEEQQLSFWMKNTPHPLSIAYIDKNGKIRDIFDMEPYSLSPILSTRSVMYALEVPKGWYDANGIKVGDHVEIPRNYR